MNELLLSKAIACRNRILRIRGRLPDAPEVVLDDEMLEAFLSFHVFLLIQDAVDLAVHMVTAKGLGVASSQRDGFEMLTSAGLITSAVARDMGTACGLRNRIAHTYGEVDAVRLVREVPLGLQAVERFLDEFTPALTAL